MLVNGYTDNQPIRTARFPSNFELSQARADAVAAVLRAKLSDPNARAAPRASGDADPIASNATPDGRQQNRRTEIVLRAQASSSACHETADAMILDSSIVRSSRWVTHASRRAACWRVLVWFFGPLLGIGVDCIRWRPRSRADHRHRGAAACCGWCVNLLHELRARRKREKALADGVAAADRPTEPTAASAEEVALLADRLSEAMHALKRAKLGGVRGG